jgi:hypothetical protein
LDANIGALGIPKVSPGAISAVSGRTSRALPADLTDADLDAIAKLLRDTIAADRFPLSPRVRAWKAILDKLEPPASRPGTRIEENRGTELAA